MLVEPAVHGGRVAPGGDDPVECAGGVQPTAVATANGTFDQLSYSNTTSRLLFGIGNDDRLYVSVGVIIPHDNLSLEVFAKGGVAKINGMKVYELKSAWGLA